jgi:hypothetical protein
MSPQLDSVLSRLRAVRREGASYKALCPVHSETTGSLDIKEGDTGVLVKCFGCNATPERICEAIGLRVADLFHAQRNGSHAARPSALTLEGFARAKGLPQGFLEQHGISEKDGVLLFVYLLMNGQRASRQRIRVALTGAKRFLWTKGEGRPTLYGLWRLAQAMKRGATDLYLCEGESDALTLWLHGLEALGIPGADMCNLLQTPHVNGFRRVFIIKENDATGGETFAKGLSGRLAQLEYRGEVRVIEMAGANCKDPNELHLRHLTEPGVFESEFGLLAAMAKPVDLPIVGLEVFDASTIEEKPIEFIWKNRIARGKLTLICGAPGIGKSFFTLDLASRLSTGAPFPDGVPNGVIRDTIIFSAEDGMADTIVARLIAHGADRTRTKICKRIREMNDSGEMVRRGFNLARDLPHLERLLDQYPNTQLIIIDPISAYGGRTDSYKNAEQRSEVLDPLSELAERRNVAIVAVTHWNKSSNSSSLERVSGSIAFPAAARQVWGFVSDPEDVNRTLMLFGKSNIGPRVSGLAFRIPEPKPGERTKVIWETGDVNHKLEEVLRQERSGEKENEVSKLERACDLIREMCANGPVPSKDIDARGKELGIGERTMFKARKDILKCRATKEGYGKDGPWMISLPSLP